jgi:hypothetical protein
MGPFKLKDLGNGHFQVHSPKGAFEGPKDVIFAKAKELGVQYGELDIASDFMEEQGHEIAHFGIFGKFLFTDTKRKAA